MADKRHHTGSERNEVRRIFRGKVISRCLSCTSISAGVCKKTKQEIDWPASGPIPDWCPLPAEKVKDESA